MTPHEVLQQKGVFDIRNGSAEIFFDDTGEVQQIIYRIKKVKRDGVLEVRSGSHIRRGTAMAYFDPDGVLQKVIYETVWRKNKSGH